MISGYWKWQFNRTAMALCSFTGNSDIVITKVGGCFAFLHDYNFVRFQDGPPSIGFSGSEKYDTSLVRCMLDYYPALFEKDLVGNPLLIRYAKKYYYPIIGKRSTYVDVHFVEDEPAILQASEGGIVSPFFPAIDLAELDISLSLRCTHLARQVGHQYKIFPYRIQNDDGTTDYWIRSEVEYGAGLTLNFLEPALQVNTDFANPFS